MSNNDVSDKYIQVFPNPNGGSFQVKCAGKMESLGIYSASGALVYLQHFENDSGLNQSVFIQDKPAGIYFGRATLSGRTYTFKVLVASSGL